MPRVPLGVTTGNQTFILSWWPYQARHSSLGNRTKHQLMDRGRWRSHSSLQRNEKHASVTALSGLARLLREGRLTAGGLILRPHHAQPSATASDPRQRGSERGRLEHGELVKDETCQVLCGILKPLVAEQSQAFPCWQDPRCWKHRSHPSGWVCQGKRSLDLGCPTPRHCTVD